MQTQLERVENWDDDPNLARQRGLRWKRDCFSTNRLIRNEQLILSHIVRNPELCLDIHVTPLEPIAERATDEGQIREHASAFQYEVLPIKEIYTIVRIGRKR